MRKYTAAVVYSQGFTFRTLGTYTCKKNRVRMSCKFQGLQLVSRLSLPSPQFCYVVFWFSKDGNVGSVTKIVENG